MVIFRSFLYVYQRVSLFVTLTAPSSAALISSVSRSIPTVETFQGLYPQTPGLDGQKGANFAGFVAIFPIRMALSVGEKYDKPIRLGVSNIFNSKTAKTGWWFGTWPL